jgi:hypothetical protein
VLEKAEGAEEGVGEVVCLSVVHPFVHPAVSLTTDPQPVLHTV